MRKTLKQHVPLILLLVMTAFWSWYYLSSHALNDYGYTKSEWLLLLDGVIFLPLICLYFFRDNIKLGVAKALVYMCIMIMLGSWIIPDEQKKVWLILEKIRYLVLGAFILFELMAIVTLFVSIRSSLSNEADPDMSINKSIGAIFGRNFAAKILEFESRVWTYALCAQRINPNAYVGDSHYYSDLKDGVRSYLQGFIFIIVFEMPLLHVILHLTTSAGVAWIVTVLSAIGLIYMIAEYRAFKLRPVSLTSILAEKPGIIIRYSIRSSCFIPYASIQDVEGNMQFVKRSSGVKRYNLLGNPNVRVRINSTANNNALIGAEKTVSQMDGIGFVYLGLNQPQAFIQELKGKLKEIANKAGVCDN